MLLLSLLVLVAGWSALWGYARYQARAGLKQWIADEQREGRIWTCPGRRIGGYPLSIVLTCDQPTFAEVDDASFKGQLAGLRAEAHLYFPTSVVIDLAGPLTIQDNAIDGELSVTWSAARLVLRGDLPGALDRGNLAAEGVEIAAGPHKGPTRIGDAMLAFRPLPIKTAGAVDAELAITAKDLHDSDADAAFGTNDPIAIDLAATVRHLPERGASLPTLLEAWRQVGGVLGLDRFAFSKGSFQVRGAGQLSVDDGHRIQGRLDAQFAGLAPVAARFGIPVAAVNVGGLLSGLLGGKSAKADTAKSDLDLPLVARGGHLYLGPVKTGLLLPPLY